MKREKLFASSIVSATACFMILTVAGFFAYMGLEMLQGGGIILAIGCIGVLAFALLAMIMNIVLAAKTKPSKAGYSKKGLAIVIIVIEVLAIACAVLGPIMFGIQLGVFSDLGSILELGLPMIYPFILLAIALLTSIILKIVGLCGKKAPAVAHEERTEEQASV